MHIPSGVGRPGHLGIKDKKTLYSVGASRPSGSVMDENMHAHYTGVPGAPSLHVGACKAGGELTLGTYQVAWAGRLILASRIKKHYIV